MFRTMRVRFLAFAILVGLVLISGATLVEAAVKPPAVPTVPGPTVCYFVAIGYTNIGNSTETVNAQVILFPSKQTSTQSFQFTLQAGESGVFHIEFLIPDPSITFQFLAGNWFTNPNMQITSYDEGYLDLEDCIGHTFDDGRINDGENEKAAPVVAYCEDDGIGVYDIDPQSQGNLVFRVSYDDVADGIDEAQSSGEAVTLGSGADDHLYALADGHLQLSGPEQFTGKPYNYIFAGDFCD